MKTISEVIAELEEAKAKYGDIEVRYMNMPLNWLRKLGFESWIRFE